MELQKVYEQGFNKLEQDDEWRLASDYVLFTGLNIFLTGRAGTGKTTFLCSLKEKSHKRMVIVAPTGIAAINAGGVTIHSFFSLPTGPLVPTRSLAADEEDFNTNNESAANRYSKKSPTSSVHRLRSEKIKIIRSLDLLVIDEISMVRADLLDTVDRILKFYRHNQKPFGGVQLLMIGDLQQLPPVTTENEINILQQHYDNLFFFGSNVLRNSPYICIELTKVFRQHDNLFIDILNKVREGDINEKILKMLNSRYIEDLSTLDEDEYITLTTHNNLSKAINDQKLDALKSESFTYKASISGEFPPSSFPTDAELQLKVGAQVMFIKNDISSERRYYNGKIGVITALDEDIAEVTCKGDPEPIAVEMVEWSNMRYNIDSITQDIREELLGSFYQLPLKLAWAITIHKSQGLTFDKVIIDANLSFAHGQVYVALSRCKSLDGLVLKSKISKSSIINNLFVRRFQEDITSTQPEETDLIKAKTEYRHSLIMELFDFTTMLILVRRIKKSAVENQSVLTGTPATVFTDMEQLTIKEITSVADRFAIQLKQIFRDDDMNDEEEYLNERVSAASVYFKDKIETIIVNNVETPCYDTDNKIIKAQLKGDSERLLSEATIKLACLTTCKKSFDIQKYLKAKALAAIAPVRVKRTASEQADGKNTPNKELVRILKAWRNEKAENADVEVYMVMSVKAIEQIAEKKPLSTKELLAVKGIGKKKVAQFGDEIIEIISQYTGKLPKE